MWPILILQAFSLPALQIPCFAGGSYHSAGKVRDPKDDAAVTRRN
jgi:hypothetical protein